ncbi:MAG: RHS repeat-associated core domain-containing protein, partial [Acholeplasmataceae bacterium]|nr:RHS repeat-associated core domain-containing protein [Acholeplasmataceae bacterium]
TACYKGQLAQAELGLDYYVARYYDPLTGHFIQADSIIPEPGKASAFDRYAYVRNNPIRYNDPSGHRDSGECGPGEDCEKKERKPYIKRELPELMDETTKKKPENVVITPIIGFGFTETQSSKAIDFGLVSLGPITSIDINQPTPIAITSANENGEFDGFQIDSDYIFGSYNPINGDYGYGFRTPNIGNRDIPNQFAFEYHYENNNLYDSEITFAVYPIDNQNNLRINEVELSTEYMAGTFVSYKDKGVAATALVTITLLVYGPEIPMAAAAFCGSSNLCGSIP